MSRSFIALWMLAVIAFMTPVTKAQTVFQHSNPTTSLEDRFEWAHQEARQQGLDVYWIVYSVRRQMKEDSWMGHFSHDWRDMPTLAEILTGRVVEKEESIRQADQQALNRANQKRSERMVEKVVVILQQFRTGELIEVNQSNIELAYDLENQGVFWLAGARDGESITILIDEYGDASNTDVSEDLVSAVGVHDDLTLVRPFLIGVIESRAHSDVRQRAVFWMSRHASMETVRYLDQLVEKDRSEDVRESAVFSLSRIELDGALDRLIRLARYADDEEIREEARFWLGQRASAILLGEVDDDGEKSQLQKQAVFALTQMDDEGVDELIRLAQTHSNPVVRKQAIFWLGQTESDRALDAIIEMLRPGS